MRKHTILELINDVFTMLEMPTVDTIEDLNDNKKAVALACMKYVAEEVSTQLDWIEQLKRVNFTINHQTAYNPVSGGYNLQELTDGLFDRFTSGYIYDMSNKKVIPEIKTDDKIAMEMTGDTFTYRFFRSGDEMIFSPDIPNGTNISFFYQTSMIAYINDDILGKHYYDKFDDDNQYSVLDDKMLVRGSVARYRIAIGMNDAREARLFEDYLTLIKGARSPQGILSGFNQTYGFGAAIDILGIPLF